VVENEVNGRRNTAHEGAAIECAVSDLDDLGGPSEKESVLPRNLPGAKTVDPHLARLSASLGTEAAVHTPVRRVVPE
jgi:hypothetical protein